MTYGEFLEETKTDEYALALWLLWWHQKVALYPAIELYKKYKKNKNIQLSFNL